MIKKIAIAALSAAAVLGLGTSHNANASYAVAMNDITNFQIMAVPVGMSTLTVISGYSTTLCAPACTTTPIFPGVLFLPVPSAVPGGSGSFAQPSNSQSPLSLSPTLVGSATTSLGNPFNSTTPFSMTALGISGASAGAGPTGDTAYGSNDIGALDFTVAGSMTLWFSFTDSIVLETVGAARAAVSNFFNITGPAPSLGEPPGYPYEPSAINTSCSSAPGGACTITFTDSFSSSPASLSTGTYSINVGPLAQAETVFEPSSMLLLSSGLAGLAFAACRRKPTRVGV
jgi:hypothetical protein